MPGRAPCRDGAASGPSGCCSSSTRSRAGSRATTGATCRSTSSHGDRIERIAIVGDERWRSESLMFASAGPADGARSSSFRRSQLDGAARLAVGLRQPQRTSDEACQTRLRIRSRPAGGPRPFSSVRRRTAGARAAIGARPGGRETGARRLRATTVAVDTAVDGGWPRSTTCRAAARSSSTSRRSRAGTSRRTWSPTAPCRYRAKAGDKPALGTIKLEADTRVALDERLVNFQKLKITEANFQTLPKEQMREIAARDRQGDSRRRARHRARSRARERRQEPDRAEERRGHEGGSADDLLQQDAGGDRQPRRRADLEPDQGERSEVRRQHELGSVPARADQDALPAEQRHAG